MREQAGNETGIAVGFTAWLPHSRKQDQHKVLIEQLRAYPEVRFSGFWAAMRSLPDAPYVQQLLSKEEDWLQHHKFVPDAWALHVEEREIALFEVVMTHDIPSAKISKINNFAWALDEDYYSLGLVRCDLAGRTIYDCVAMSICTSIDRVNGDEDSLKHWRKYTQQYCERRLTASAPE